MTKVILESVYYAFFAIILFLIIRLSGNNISYVTTSSLLSTLIKMLFTPMTSGVWWFITAYVFLLIFVPVINSFLTRLNNKGVLLFLCVDWFLWYCIPSEFNGVFASFQKAVFFYSIGALIRTKFTKISKTRFYLFLFVAFWILFALCKYKSASIYAMGDEASISKKILETALDFLCTGIFTPLASFSLFKFFEGINLGVNKWINTLSATTFGVYLIHDSIVGRYLLWNIMINPVKMQYHMILYPFYAFITILLIYICCSIIDIVRLKLFEPKAIIYANNLCEYIKLKYFV